MADLIRTPETLERLEEALCKNHGDMSAAARDIQTSARYIHMWALSDPEVAARIREAQMIGWAALEGALYERAVLGVEEDVYYQGDVVGTRTVRSDALLALMAKARIPGYSEASNHQHTHMVNVAIMPRATTYEEWQSQRETELAEPSVGTGRRATELSNEPPAHTTNAIEGVVRVLELAAPAQAAVPGHVGRLPDWL